jgi:hypothetical protein
MEEEMSFVKKYLSADGLHKIVRHCFDQEEFPTNKKSKINFQDCIMSGLAIFGLKMPSLLKFEQEKLKPFMKRNLKNLYHIQRTPSDTHLRRQLDQLSPKYCRKPFKVIFSYLQRGGMLKRYKYMEDYYIISIDGTGQYVSNKVHCENCCEKKHRNGETTYYHQMLGAVIVHPEEKVVIPLAPEPIVKGDGNTKNDCERNASKRLLKDLRKEHPHLKGIVVEDGLAANYPHLSLLDSLNLKYVISVKNGDHDFLFDWIKQAKGKEVILRRNQVKNTFRYVNQVPLNDANFNYKVNVLEYWEEKPNGKKQYFSWVTSFEITDKNVFELMKAGRARWSIENETFNTLKNQGYNFGHNYGHGNHHLCSVMTMLMLLAFLIDQVQQLCCYFYQKARQKVGALNELFIHKRTLVQYAIWRSWQDLYETIICPLTHPPPIGILSSE